MANIGENTVVSQQFFADKEMPEFCMTKDALYAYEPIIDCGLVLGHEKKLIMTKEMFQKCYEQWIKN